MQISQGAKVNCPAKFSHRVLLGGLAVVRGGGDGRCGLRPRDGRGHRRHGPPAGAVGGRRGRRGGVVGQVSSADAGGVEQISLALKYFKREKSMGQLFPGLDIGALKRVF